MAKKKATEPDEDVTFEQALEELEQIVGKLEGGKLPLADSLSAYETGVKRLKCCYQLLTSAERKIELVQGVDSEGRVTAMPFGDEATADLADKTAARSRRRTARVDSDGGLF